MNELFRLNINNAPYGDSTYLGDRSIVAFILDEGSSHKLYFSVYNYGKNACDDSTNEYHEIDVTNELTQWFYIYTAVSVNKRAAMIYVKLGEREEFA